MLARIWGKGILIHCWWECKLVQPVRKQYEGSSKTLKIELSYGSPIPLLGIHQKECKSGYNKDTFTPIFTAALFIIPKLWK
jgi:hypothetical protein